MQSLYELLAPPPPPRPLDPAALSTGFFDLDCAVGGWHRGDLILLAEGAEPGGLASILASHCVLTAAIQEGVSTALVSLISSAMRWSLSLLAVHAGHHHTDLRTHRADDPELERATRHLCSLPVTLCGLTAADLAELEETVLQLSVRHRLVVIHGLSHLAQRHRAAPVHLLHRMQELACSLALPMVCLVPAEYIHAVDADVGLKIEVDAGDHPPTAATVRVVRNRHGELAWVHLSWDPLTATLGPLDAATKDYGGQRFQEPVV